MAKSNKRQLGELEESLVNDIENYVKEVNKHRPKSKKISKIGLIRNYFTELLANKVLTNDYMDLDNAYYYNLEDLRTNSEIIASTEFISEPEKQVKIEKIPNNLDSWSIEEETYCYNNNPEEHKGVNITVLYYPSKDNLLEVNYIVYNLTGSGLKVGLVKSNYLGIFLDKPEEQELLKELKSIEAEINEDIEKGLPKFLITAKYNSRSYFKMLFQETVVNLMAKLVGMFIIKWSQTNAILKEAYSIGVERMPDNVLEDYNNKLELVHNDYIEKRNELIYNIIGSDINKYSEEDAKLKLNNFIEENPSFYYLKELLKDNEEDVDLINTAKKLETGCNKILDLCYENGFNPLEFITSLLDSSEDSNNTKKLIDIRSKYTVEDYVENPDVMKDFLAELHNSFNIDFGFNPKEDS